MFWFIKKVNEHYEVVSISDLIEINGEVEIIIDNTDSSSAHNSLCVLLKAYPGIKFTLDKSAQNLINRRDFDQVVTRGDSIILNIAKKDYQKKLLKEVPIGFLEKYLSRDVTIYGLRNKAIILLDTTDYFPKSESYNRGGGQIISHFFNFIALVFLLGGAMKIYPVVKDKL